MATWTRKAGSLSTDLNGWCMGSDIAVDTNGDLYAVWKQEYLPSNGQSAQVRVKKYSGGVWAPLGGALGFSGRPVTQPRIITIGTTPYVAWVEMLTAIQIHVVHWDGFQWIHDTGAGANGAVVDRASEGVIGLQKPALLDLNGTLMLAYFCDDNAAHIKTTTLSGGVWSAEANITSGVSLGDMPMCLDLARGTSNAWLMISRHLGNRSLNVWERTGTGTWVQRGGDLRNSANDIAPHASLTVLGNTPYVAFSEGTLGGPVGEMGGPHQVLVKHWDTAAWVADGASNNVNTLKHAGRPTIKSDGTNLFLAWCEGFRGEKAKLYSRKLTSGVWGAVDGPLNALSTFSADAPRIIARNNVANIIWSERASGFTKQVYVAGTDGGVPQTPTAPLDYGNDGNKPTLVDNTWQFLNPAKGAVENTLQIGDEGYSSTYYSPGLNKTIFFGKYHNGPVQDGEAQNALLAYDFTRHRVDLLEIADGDYSENLHAYGHDEGNYAFDSNHDVFVALGAKTLSGIRPYMTYQYDVVAGRGKRMMPLNDDLSGDNRICAFDTSRNRIMRWTGTNGILYDLAANVTAAQISLPSGQSSIFDPGLCYLPPPVDLFVMIHGCVDQGGFVNLNTVYTLPAGNPGAGWTLRPTTGVGPSARMNPNVNLDTVNNVIMVASGYAADTFAHQFPGFLDTFILNPTTWVWTSAGTIPYQNEGSALNAGGTGNEMVYDSTAQCFLLRNSAFATHWYRYKYTAAGTSLPGRTWVSKPAPTVNQGPHPGPFGGGKHGRMIADTTRQRMIFGGGDYLTSLNQSTSFAGAQLWPLNFSTWSWTPAIFRWCAATDMNVPETHCSSGYYYDSRRDQIVIAGGQGTDAFTVLAMTPGNPPTVRAVNSLGSGLHPDFLQRFFTGDTHGTNIITNISPAIAPDGHAIDSEVRCLGAQVNTFVQTVDSPTQVTLNKAISGTNTGLRLAIPRNDNSISGLIVDTILTVTGITGLGNGRVLLANEHGPGFTYDMYKSDATDLVISGSFTGGTLSSVGENVATACGAGHGIPTSLITHSLALNLSTLAWTKDEIPPPFPGGWGGDGGSSFSVYDHQTDQLVKVYGSGFFLYSRGAGTVPTVGWTGPFVPTGSTEFNWAQTAIDAAGNLGAGTPRAVYIIDVGPDPIPPASHQGKLIRFDLDTHAFAYFNLPSDWTFMNLSGGNMLAMDIDTSNRKLAIVNAGVDSFNGHAALIFFDLDTHVFEPNEVAPATVDGYDVAVNCIKYDPFDNAFISMGRSRNPQSGAEAHWAYRYAAGGPPPPPPPPPLNAQRVASLSVGLS